MFDTNDRQFIVGAMRIEAARPSVTRRLALARDLNTHPSSGTQALPASLRWIRLQALSVVEALLRRPALNGPETEA